MKMLSTKIIPCDTSVARYRRHNTPLVYNMIVHCSIIGTIYLGIIDKSQHYRFYLPRHYRLKSAL